MALNPKASTLGITGERIAENYLKERGLQILDRNWRIKEGELDLVAHDCDHQIIFIEVKTRSTAAFGDPLESITREKALRIQRLALAWLATHQRLGANYRIDVVGIVIGRSGEISLDHRKGVL